MIAHTEAAFAALDAAAQFYRSALEYQQMSREYPKHHAHNIASMKSAIEKAIWHVQFSNRLGRPYLP